MAAKEASVPKKIDTIISVVAWYRTKCAKGIGQNVNSRVTQILRMADDPDIGGRSDYIEANLRLVASILAGGAVCVERIWERLQTSLQELDNAKRSTMVGVDQAKDVADQCFGDILINLERVTDAVDRAEETIHKLVRGEGTGQSWSDSFDKLDAGFAADQADLTVAGVAAVKAMSDIAKL